MAAQLSNRQNQIRKSPRRETSPALAICILQITFGLAAVRVGAAEELMTQSASEGMLALNRAYSWISLAFLRMIRK